MNVRTVFHVLGWTSIAVGSADLLLGNTPNGVLPDFIANQLTQQGDIVLIGLGVIAVIFV
jgi:hypothetical protein